MSKKNIYNPSFVTLSEIFWFSECNEGRDISIADTSTERDAHTAMLHEEWFENTPVAVIPMTKDRQEEAVKRLMKQWDNIKISQETRIYPVNGAKAEVSPTEYQVAWEATYTKNGKVIPPEYEAVYAYQRGLSLYGVPALRKKQGLDSSYPIPVLVRNYSWDSYERTQECILENTSKIAGAKLIDLHGPSLVRAGVALRDKSRAAGKPAKEIEIIRCISGGASDSAKRGTGQKVYYIVTLDQQFPKLGIVKNVMDTEKGQSYWKSLRNDKLRELVIGTRTGSDKPVTDEAVEAYFSNPKAEEVQAVQLPKKTDMKTWCDTTSNLLVKYFLDALVNKGELHRLSQFDAPSVVEGCNAIAAKLGITRASFNAVKKDATEEKK